MSMLQLEERPLDGGVALRLEGEVDSSTAAVLRDAFRRVPKGEAVVVDLQRVPFMDSAGLGALICGIRELRTSRGAVALCVKRGGVQHLLSVTGFDRIVPITTSVGEAQEAITEQELGTEEADRRG